MLSVHFQQVFFCGAASEQFLRATLLQTFETKVIVDLIRNTDNWEIPISLDIWRMEQWASAAVVANGLRDLQAAL